MAALDFISVFLVLFQLSGSVDATCTYSLTDSGHRHVYCQQYYAYYVPAGTIAGAVFGSFTFIALIVFIICFCCWLRKRNSAGTPGTVARTPAPVNAQIPNPEQPVNPVMQQAYPMTSQNDTETLRMHTGYDQ